MIINVNIPTKCEIIRIITKTQTVKKLKLKTIYTNNQKVGKYFVEKFLLSMSNDSE
jgi:hypothetical protein